MKFTELLNVQAHAPYICIIYSSARERDESHAGKMKFGLWRDMLAEFLRYVRALNGDQRFCQSLYRCIIAQSLVPVTQHLIRDFLQSMVLQMRTTTNVVQVAIGQIELTTEKRPMFADISGHYMKSSRVDGSFGYWIEHKIKQITV